MDVLRLALQSIGLKLEVWTMPKGINNQLYKISHFLLLYSGYICNWAAHWLSLRYLYNTWYLFDSLKPEGPLILTDFYLSTYLTSLISNGYSVFSVEGKLPDMVVTDDMEYNPRYFNLDTKTNKPMSKEEEEQKKKDDWKNTKGYELSNKKSIKRNKDITDEIIKDLLPPEPAGTGVMLEIRFSDGFRLRRKYDENMVCSNFYEVIKTLLEIAYEYSDDFFLSVNDDVIPNSEEEPLIKYNRSVVMAHIV